MFDGLISSVCNGQRFQNGVDLISAAIREDLSSCDHLLSGLFSEVCHKTVTRRPGGLCLVFHLHFFHIREELLLSEGFSMAGVTRKGSGRPSYYYRFLGKSRLQRQRSRSRSRTRPPASRGNKYYQYFSKKKHLPVQQF